MLGDDDMLKTKKIICLVILGCMIFAGGFLYDVMFAGIPFQDAPPELLARYNFHASVAGYLYRSGLGVFILGIALAIIKATSHFYFWVSNR